jgi:hypothetical protein
MIEALCDHRSEKPDLYLDKMAVFLLDKFHIPVTEEPLSLKVGLKRLLGSKLGSEMPTYENIIYTVYRTLSHIT